MSGIAGKGLCLLSGIGLPGYWVNTELIIKDGCVVGSSVSPLLRRGGGGVGVSPMIFGAKK